MNKTNEQVAVSVARNSIIVNIALSAFKLFAGILGNSAALVSDALHSITDLIGTIIAIIGIKLGNKTADKNHPYGHERFESLATLALASLIAVVGVGIGFTALTNLFYEDVSGASIPGIIALVGAIVSIFTKEGIFWYVRAAAKKTNSTALMADAWHSRADGISSVGSLIGVLGARLGFPVLDSLAALVISLFILKTAYDITKEAINQMTDTACDDQTIEEIHQVIMSQHEVIRIDSLRTRVFGNKFFIDVEIGIDAQMTFKEAHDVIHVVHDAIEHHFSTLKHCEVHANPVELSDERLNVSILESSDAVGNNL